MRNFQDTFETCKRSFISTFSICMTVPLIWISRVFIKFYYVTNIFDLHTFENEMTAYLKCFEISAEMLLLLYFF